MAIASVNPTNGEKLKEFAALSSEDVETKLANACRAFDAHRRTSFSHRARLINAAADQLEKDKSSLAKTMTLEMGKLFRAAEEEITKCVRGCRFYAENAERFLGSQETPTETARNEVRYEPMGPILAVMP